MATFGVTSGVAAGSSMADEQGKAGERLEVRSSGLQFPPPYLAYRRSAAIVTSGPY
jgi:hypothetical protein